jgi:purine-binding chemotaxis protein CheW
MSEAIAEPPVGIRSLAGKYLTFSLHNESYGIEVLKVREIIRITNITMVPQMPAYVRGVINLRGKIVPVIDLRLRFDLAPAESTDKSCIIVVQVSLPERKTTQMGLVVDAVEEVVNISAADIEEAPDFGSTLLADYLLGMAKIKGVVKTLLDIDRVIAVEVVQVINNQPKP